MAAGDPVLLNFGLKAIVSGAAGTPGQALWSPEVRPSDASHVQTWYDCYSFLEQSAHMYLCFSGVVPANATLTNLTVKGTFLQAQATAGSFNIEAGFNAIKSGASGTDPTAAYTVTYRPTLVAALATVLLPNPWSIAFSAAQHGLAVGDEAELWIRRSSDAPDDAPGAAKMSAESIQVVEA